MNILKKTLLIGLSSGAVGCGVARNANVESGTVIDRVDLPEEMAIFINLDADTTNAERKLFFSDMDFPTFRHIQIGDYVHYTNTRGRRFIDIGQDDKILRINGQRMARVRRNRER